jgi:hypothetical protein
MGPILRSTNENLSHRVTVGAFMLTMEPSYHFPKVDDEPR